MIKRRELREMTHVKLHEMASILLDDIIVPGEIRQEGQESIMASCIDRNGNKYLFNLSLTVTPEEIVQSEPAPTLADQISTIIEELVGIKEDISTLKGYHTQIEIPTEQDNGEPSDIETPTENPTEAPTETPTENPTETSVENNDNGEDDNTND